MFKFNNTFLGMLIFVYVFSVALCSVDFIGTDGYAKNDPQPDTHCRIDLNSNLTANEQSSFLIDLTRRWHLLAQIIEPHLPILSFSIFKIPKPA